MFEKILEYQKLDGKLRNLKREFDNNPAKQNLEKIKAIGKDAQNKLIELETKAKTAIADHAKYKAEYEKIVTQLNAINKTSVDSMTEEQINANLEKANALVNVLVPLERNLSSQAKLVEDILKNFEVCRNNIVINKQKYTQCKAECDKFEENSKPQFEEIKKQMLEMEKDIDKNLLAKYKHCRQDKKFPVFVPLNNNSCGGCSMEISAALMNKLKADGYLECEQCRRYIYL